MRYKELFKNLRLKVVRAHENTASRFWRLVGEVTHWHCEPLTDREREAIACYRPHLEQMGRTAQRSSGGRAYNICHSRECPETCHLTGVCQGGIDG